MTPIPRYRLLLTLATILCCAFLLRATYDRGLERGLGTAIEWGPFSFQISLACAITDSVYRFNLGYVCAAPVYKKLVAVQMAGDETEKVIPRLRDGAIINRSIKEASELGPLQHGALDTGELMTPYYNDLGMIDFIKSAFRLYGPAIESLYKLFFTFLAVSVLAFILAFPGNLLASATIIAVTYGFFAEINSAMFNEYMPSVYAMRYPSVLVIIPALHLTLLLAWKKPLTAVNLLLAVPQVLLMVLAIKIRFSAVWGLVSVLAVVGYQCLVPLIAELRSTRKDWRIAVVDAIARAMRWPAILCVGAVALHGAYMRTAIHPIYDSDEVLAEHMTWHSFFQNYAAFDPNAMALSGLTGAAARGDDISWMAARLYAQRVRLTNDYKALNASITHFGLRVALHDKLMRRVFFGYIAQHPIRAFRIYALQKPLDVVKRYWSATSAAIPVWTTLTGYGLSAAFAVCLLFLPWSVAQARALVFTLAAIGFISALPHIAGAPSIVYFNDLCIVWPAVAYLCLPLFLVQLIAWNRPGMLTRLFRRMER